MNLLVKNRTRTPIKLIIAVISMIFSIKGDNSTFINGSGMFDNVDYKPHPTQLQPQKIKFRNRHKVSWHQDWEAWWTGQLRKRRIFTMKNIQVTIGTIWQDRGEGKKFEVTGINQETVVIRISAVGNGDWYTTITETAYGKVISCLPSVRTRLRRSRTRHWRLQLNRSPRRLS